MGKARWPKCGRELHQPKDLALPKEGSSRLRVPGKRRSNKDQEGAARQDGNQGQDWGAIQPGRSQLCQVKRHRACLQASPTSPKGKWCFLLTVESCCNKKLIVVSVMRLRVMVVTRQQCSCLHPLVWIGHKLPAQLPRPAPGPTTSTGRHSRLWRMHRPEPLASVRLPTNDAKPSSPFQTTKQRMRTSSSSSLESGGDKWG